MYGRIACISSSYNSSQRSNGSELTFNFIGGLFLKYPFIHGKWSYTNMTKPKPPIWGLRHILDEGVLVKTTPHPQGWGQIHVNWTLLWSIWGLDVIAAVKKSTISTWSFRNIFFLYFPYENALLKELTIGVWLSSIMLSFSIPMPSLGETNIVVTSKKGQTIMVSI